MSWQIPSVQAFKDNFFRDFNYASATDQNNLNLVTDRDINKAYAEARLAFNPDLFGTDEQVTIVFLYLAAFYLVLDLQNSSQGLGAQANFPITGKSVGNVSINFSIPEKILKNPQLAIYAGNGYGMKYLSLVAPVIVGRVGIACGTTLPG
jgi:hypothetical protein